MIAVHIKEAYADALVPLEPSVEEALRRLALERATRRIAELEQKLLAWQEKYHGSYAYYVLEGDRVIAGFDNAPDAQVRRLKYGPIHTLHRYERIPHHHMAGKVGIELTSEMSCADLIAWIKANLPQSGP